MPGSPRRSRAKATSSPGSITIAPTLTTRAPLTSPTRSGSGRATSRRLLKDPVWGNAIDAQRICVAGHSQGGFTSLWIGGAKVNADKFLAFQQGWKNNQLPDAKLVIIPGLVDHEIFINECDDEGRDEFPEACIDAPGVDRHAIHRDIGAAALTFFDAHLPSEGEK